MRVYVCLLQIPNRTGQWNLEAQIVLYSKIATHRLMECFPKIDYRRDIVLEMILGRMKRA